MALGATVPGSPHQPRGGRSFAGDTHSKPVSDARALGKQKLPLTSLKFGNSVACAPELPKTSLAL